MVENSRSNESFESNIQRYTGVASVSILAINPNNDKLRQFGWQIASDAPEPVYASITQRNGKDVNTGRVRLLVQIQDLEDKPVIPIDFWCHSSYEINNSGDKCRVMDDYVRTAWATKNDIKMKRVPQYTNGPASISTPYHMCHEGEEILASFLAKYLNVTPYQIFDRNKNAYVNSKNPGRVILDYWDDLTKGNITKFAEDIALQPDNRVKIILGVRRTDDNKTYQTFFTGTFFSDSYPVDKVTGEYVKARKEIDKFFADGRHSQYSFSACPVKVWQETASVVQDNAQDFYNVPEEPESFDPQENNDELPF